MLRDCAVENACAISVWLNIDGEKIGDAKMIRLQVVGEKMLGLKIDGEKMLGLKIDGEKMLGLKIDGEKMLGLKIDGLYASGLKMDGEKIEGEKIDGEKIDGAYSAVSLSRSFEAAACGSNRFATACPMPQKTARSYSAGNPVTFTSIRCPGEIANLYQRAFQGISLRSSTDARNPSGATAFGHDS